MYVSKYNKPCKSITSFTNVGSAGSMKYNILAVISGRLSSIVAQLVSEVNPGELFTSTKPDKWSRKELVAGDVKKQSITSQFKLDRRYDIKTTIHIILV